jgi:hypothetical protein
MPGDMVLGSRYWGLPRPATSKPGVEMVGNSMGLRVGLTLLVASIVVMLVAQDGDAQANPNLPACRVGLHVPIVSPLNYGGTILAFDVAKGSYQVKSDSDGLIDWIPARNLRYSCAGADAVAVTQSYFMGRWSLFLGPTAHHEVIDSKGYLVVGSGAHVPPLQINTDGSYVWVIDSRTTIRGKWRAMSQNELRSGTRLPAVLLLNGEGGKNWEVWKTGVNPGNNRDAISVERMDLGESYQGTRLP